MRFPQTFIDDLRRQADIVRVVQDYVPSLKKKGANWSACCPFHQEKTPSFSVNPAKDIFYCFGCKKGGSIFNFVMEIERLSFPEAIKVVAEKAGVPLPRMENDGKFEQKRQEADEVVKLNEWALDFWEEKFKGNEREARAAREYVAGRGITDETRAAFRLGYAPDSWDALTNHLKKRGASEAEIERSGLVVRKEKGGFYDRFRGRVIFPVLDVRGRPVAFGARTMEADGEPKYLNSPETAAYTKGRHLYGLFQAREEIRKRKFAILVEGYLDALVPFQFGVRNVVASLGTSLTAEQVKLLGRFARKVVVNYDGDKAGIGAVKRAIEMLVAEDFETKVLVLPDNADPDEFIKKYGVEEYGKRRGAAIPHIQFVLEQATRDRNLARPEDKRDAVEEALPALRAVRNRILKREYFDLAMDTLRVEPALRRELWKAAQPNAKAENAGAQRQSQQDVEYAEPPAPDITVAEQQLLEIFVHDADLRREILPQIERADYESLPTASVFAALKQMQAEGAPFDFARLRELTAEDYWISENFVPQLMMSEPQREEGEATDDLRAQALKCLTAMRLIMVDKHLQMLAAEIAAAERAGESERLDKLVMERLEWTRRRNNLLFRAHAQTV
ncbi:MAG: DNA primase [Pyrinomonadaceae bacterium]|nr:DNA primase [Pyrinomonadaceae bacterium]